MKLDKSGPGCRRLHQRRNLHDAFGHFINRMHEARHQPRSTWWWRHEKVSALKPTSYMNPWSPKSATSEVYGDDGCDEEIGDPKKLSLL